MAANCSPELKIKGIMLVASRYIVEQRKEPCFKEVGEDGPYSMSRQRDVRDSKEQRKSAKVWSGVSGIEKQV